MAPLMIALMWLAGIMFYGLMAGITYGLYRTQLSKKQEATTAEEAAAYCAMAWPFMLPAAIHFIDIKSHKAARAQAKRREELLAADHRVSLAVLQAEETRILERNLLANLPV